MTDDTDNSSETRTGWTRNRTTLVLAIGFVVFVVVAAAGVLGGRLLTGNQHSDPQSTSTLSTPPGPTPSPPREGGFGPLSADGLGRPVAHPFNAAGQALPQSAVSRPDYRCELPPNCAPVPAPEAMMWQEIKPSVLPFSTSDGPARIDGVAATGYTRTPQGAALAALQIFWRAVASRTNFDVITDRQMVGSPEDLEALKATKDWDYTSRPATIPRPSAFRVTAWQDEFAALQFAVPTKDPGIYSTLALEVVWRDGDWKLRAPSTPSPQRKVISLVGWTQW
ncbi:hypothetical protein [Nocardia carnea]|uniref:hypothetical protein n=1 Tax=Nocardia carnea TaxID=37328 RepID=UPI0002EA06D6|nr:hypothetical protein [Nocardia carnea]